MKIVVLAGGISTERDVSLVSGRDIYRALKENGHQAILLDLFLGLPEPERALDQLFGAAIDWAASICSVSAEAPDLESVKALRPGYRSLLGPHVLELCTMADIVFLALHGSNGEDGRIQALFDLMGIRYTGTGHVSSAISMDKDLTKRMFHALEVPTPPGVTAVKGQPFMLPDEVGFPCGGASVGVYRADDPDSLAKALEEAFSYEDQVVVERCIIGREFSIGVIDGKALPIIEIAPLEGFYDYKSKYQAGSTIETCPADLPEDTAARMQKHAEEACAAVGIEGYARVDFMLDARTGADYALEINTLPGMTPTSLLPQEAAAIGYSFPQLCEWILQVSMKKYQ